MEMLLMGLATAFTFAIIKWKLFHGRKADAILDIVQTVILVFVFTLGGGVTGGATAMVASALISIYLLFDPLIIDFPEIPKVNSKVIRILNITIVSSIVLIIAIYSAYLFI